MIARETPKTISSRARNNWKTHPKPKTTSKQFHNASPETVPKLSFIEIVHADTGARQRKKSRCIMQASVADCSSSSFVCCCRAPEEAMGPGHLLDAPRP